MIMALAVSCKDHELDEFAAGETEQRTVSAGGLSGAISKDNEKIVVPVSVTLSAPATRAFEVGLHFNQDTVAGLIADQTLENTVLLPSNAVQLPSVVEIPYGADTAVFELIIGISALEQIYGKKTALAIDLVNAGKGNQIDAANRTSLLTLNTVELLEPKEIHYLSISNGGGEVLPVQNRQNYSVTSAGINIPLGVSLAGVPGRLFSVKAAANADTVSTLVNQEVLPANTVALTPDQYHLDTLVNVPGNTNQGNLNLSIPWQVAEDNIDKQLALAVSLHDPSRHVLDPVKKTVVVLIYPERVVESDVTAEGLLSVSRDNDGGPEAGEGSLKVIDGNTQSKFLQSDFSGDLWMQLAFEDAVFAGAYTLTSANDAPERDPKDWNLQGSDDGENWVTLDTRNDEVFNGRFLTKRYEFNSAVSYSYYRLNVTDNQGSNLFQLAEWRLIKVP